MEVNIVDELQIRWYDWKLYQIKNSYYIHQHKKYRLNAVVVFEEITLLLLFIDWTESFIVSFLTNEKIVFNGKFPGIMPAR